MCGSIGENLYVSKGNIFTDTFVEPYEKCIFIMYDGRVYAFTTKDTDFIGGSVSLWIKYIEDDGYETKDVAIIMHNHFTRPFFSDTDKKTYTLLKMSGFRGSFGIYVTATDKIYLIEEMI